MFHHADGILRSNEVEEHRNHMHDCNYKCLSTVSQFYLFFVMELHKLESPFMEFYIELKRTIIHSVCITTELVCSALHTFLFHLIQKSLNLFLLFMYFESLHYFYYKCVHLTFFCFVYFL